MPDTPDQNPQAPTPGQILAGQQQVPPAPVQPPKQPQPTPEQQATAARHQAVGNDAQFQSDSPTIENATRTSAERTSQPQ